MSPLLIGYAMIALVEGYRAGLYARHQWLPNIIAGLVVGIVALPLSMAFAKLSVPVANWM